MLNSKKKKKKQFTASTFTHHFNKLFNFTQTIKINKKKKN